MNPRLLVAGVAAACCALSCPGANGEDGTAPADRGAADSSDQRDSAIETVSPAQVAVEIGASEPGAPTAPHLVGLPAATRDGKRVAYLSVTSSYSDAFRTELHVVSERGLEQVTLLAEAKDGDATPAPFAIRRQWERRMRLAASRLRREGFVPLPIQPIVPVFGKPPTDEERDAALNTPVLHLDTGGSARVGDWSIRYDPDDRLVVYDANGNFLMSQAVGVWRNWYCCGRVEPEPHGCFTRLLTLQAWGNGNVLFVAGVNNWGPDGCEMYERYVTLWPTRKRVYSEQNQTELAAGR